MTTSTVSYTVSKYGRLKTLLQMSYPTIPSQTLYDLMFNHSTFRYRRTTDDRRTDGRTKLTIGEVGLWSAKIFVSNLQYDLEFGTC